MRSSRTICLGTCLLLLCAATRSAVAARPGLEGRRTCGTIDIDQELSAPDPAVIERYIRDNRIQAGGTIPVNFHVITSGAMGNVPESQLDAQITVLNRTFAGLDYAGNPVAGAPNTGYTFVKNSVTRTDNSRWFRMTPNSSAERQAKGALAVNPTSSLNLYVCRPGQSVLGWATFPWNLASTPNQDGVVVHYAALPGGSWAPYDRGGTATHEVGHWMGLYHTFQGGHHVDATCGTAGDLVCDTPPEAAPSFGCSNDQEGGHDTAADLGHNFMDFSDDACYDSFSPGQDARADYMMSTYRPLLAAAKPAALLADDTDLVPAAEPALRVWPNPFNPTTTLDFALPRAGNVALHVYDVAGRKVATLLDGARPAGPQRAVFDGHGLPSGVYMAVLDTEGARVVRRMVLTK